MPDGKTLSYETDIPASLSESCLKYASASEEPLYAEFNSHPEGLNAPEVEQALEKFGENQISAQMPSPWWVHLWTCYRNPFNILLTILGIISYSTEGIFAAGVIGLMVVIATLLNFIQEARSTKAADTLKAMVSNSAMVLRVT